MAYTIEEIASALDAKAFGAAGLTVTGASEPATAGPHDLALAMNPDYADGLGKGQARAAIVWDGADWEALGLEAAIVVPRPRYAMSGLTTLLDPGPEIAPGIHPSAVIDPTAEIGEGAHIGPLVVIGSHVRIGKKRPDCIACQYRRAHNNRRRCADPCRCPHRLANAHW